MTRGYSGWDSDQWHATYRVKAGQETRYPDPVVTIMGAPVIVDVPGERRFCRHCNDITHSKANCRQGQRLRNRQQQLLKQQQQQQQQDQSIPHPDDQQQHQDQERTEDAFGDDYSAPPKPPVTTTTDTDTPDDARSEVLENWEAMDMEVQNLTQEQHQNTLRNAHRVVEIARRFPAQVKPETLAAAQEYIQAAAQQDGRPDRQ
jgi:hypothetical protein